MWNTPNAWFIVGCICYLFQFVSLQPLWNSFVIHLGYYTGIEDLWDQPDLWLPSSSSSFLACNSRLCSAVRWPHPPQRPVLGHIHCFSQCEIMGSQILLYDAQACDGGAPRGLLQFSGGRVDRILLTSALSPTCAMCPKRVRRCERTIAVSLGCPISLR